MNPLTKILAIDPGYDRVGIAIIAKDKERQREICLFSTCIVTDRTQSHTERLFGIGQAVERIIAEHAPTHLAIEKLFFNTNQTTAMTVAEARGILMYIGRTHNLEVCEYSPQEIKVAMTGYGKSDKSAVIDMVKRLVVNAPEKGLDDEYDAIAVGVTCLAHLRA